MPDRTLRAVSAAPVRDSTDQLTIEELARRGGMSVRNVRAHQSRGLLPPPDVRGGVGYYGDEHVARLELIREMQADGYNLASIKRLLEGAPGAAEKVLGLRRAVTAPFETEEPRLVTAQELVERFPGSTPRDLERAVRLGLLAALGDDRYEVPSPSLLDAAEELARDGVAPSAALDVAQRLRRQAEAVAGSFVKLFLDEVWQPFEAAGYPSERWDDVVASIDRLRPLATRSLVAVFQQTMSREVEAALGKVLERGPSPTPGRAGRTGSGRRP